MPKSKAEVEPLWPHLRYATLSDVRKELPSFIGGWVIVSALSVGFGWLPEFILPSAREWKSPLPHWANYALIWSAALWFLRGKTFQYRLPLLTIGGWFGLSLYLAAMIFAVFNLPWWIYVSLLWGTAIFFSTLESLDVQGRENFEALNAPLTERA